MVAAVVDEITEMLGAGGGFCMWGGTDLPIPIGAVGEVLPSLGTGPGVICYLDAVDVASLDAEERLAYLQAWQRQEAWLAGRMQAALLAVAGPEPDIVDGPRGFERDDWARDEIAAALGASTRGAAARVHTSRVLDRCLKATQDRLDAGDITWQHAQVLVDECTGLPDSAVCAVEARVIDRAPSQTVANFRQSVRRAVLALAATDDKLAEAVAKTERRVWLRPEPDGMATLGALLPAIEAQAAYQVIHQAAKQIVAGAPAQSRPLLDASRADALLALLGVDLGVARRPGSLLRRCGQSGRSAGGRSAAAGRGSAGRSGGGRSAAAGRGAGGRSGGGRSAGGRSAAGRSGTARNRCRIGRLAGDQTSRANPEDAPTGVSPFTGPGSDAEFGTSPSDAPRVSVELQIVIDAAALAGRSDNPAELIGYGPISAGAARELFAECAGDLKLRRLVTEPVVGHLLDYGRSTYRIPKLLADFVRARDRGCRFPGCLRPAAACDVDHVIAWDDGGKTAASNCACLCRRHHRLKTHAGWGFELRPDGGCIWSSPTGRQYALDPPIQLEHRRSSEKSTAAEQSRPAASSTRPPVPKATTARRSRVAGELEPPEQPPVSSA